MKFENQLTPWIMLLKHHSYGGGENVKGFSEWALNNKYKILNNIHLQAGEIREMFRSGGEKNHTH